MEKIWNFMANLTTLLLSLALSTIQPPNSVSSKITEELNKANYNHEREEKNNFPFLKGDTVLVHVPVFNDDEEKDTTYISAKVYEIVKETDGWRFKPVDSLTESQIDKYINFLLSDYGSKKEVRFENPIKKE